MLSSLNLLSDLLSSGRDEGRGLTGRRVHSSLELIAKVLEGEYLTSFQPETAQDFEVYVAAMGLDSFEEHLPANNRELAVIVGDRPEIHLYAVNRKLRLMIVTGSRPVDPLILQAAKTFEVSILVTPLDSATVIRRLKFSAPVEQTRFPEDQLELTPSDRIRDVRNQILGHFEDVVPVVDCDRRLTGAVFKQRLNAPPPFRMILVDHNEIEQSLPGVEEIPIIEVVDHHRIGMMPTATPIKFTGDVVGSTCTLVAAMFRSCGESLGADLAGLLLGKKWGTVSVVVYHFRHSAAEIPDHGRPRPQDGGVAGKGLRRDRRNADAGADEHRLRARGQTGGGGDRRRPQGLHRP